MPTQDFQKRLVAHIERDYNAGSPLKNLELPPQGMSSSVFFIKLSNGAECAVKYGANAMKDVPALELIAKKQISIPIPALIASFVFENIPVRVRDDYKLSLHLDTDEGNAAGINKMGEGQIIL